MLLDCWKNPFIYYYSPYIYSLVLCLSINDFGKSLILVASLSMILLLPTMLSSASADSWHLMSTDADEFPGPDLKAAYYKVENGILYFKVTFHGSISSINDFDVGILVDVDLNPSTGFDVDGSWYSGANTGLGAEYLILVGWEASWLFGYDGLMFRNYGNYGWDGSNPIAPDYVKIDYNQNMFVIGFKLSKFGGLGSSAKVSVLDVGPIFQWWDVWDWCPDSGNVLIRIGGLLSVFGTTSSGLAYLTISGDSGLLKIYAYPPLDDGVSYKYKLKVVSITETDEWMYIDILINYDITGGDNWLPARIVVDKINGIVYLFGPINLVGYL